MEHKDRMIEAIYSFLSRFKPKSETDFAILREIQQALKAGTPIEDLIAQFTAIGDEQLRSEIAEIEALPAPSPDANPTHPLLILDRDIDLDLSGLVDYESKIPAGEIDESIKNGCLRRIQNLQRHFDRVPEILRNTDLTDTNNPLFYDLLTAKQRINANMQRFMRIRIGLTNRFAKDDIDRDSDDPERSLLDEEPSASERVEEDQVEEDTVPSEEELMEEDLAALEADKLAKEEAEAKAAKKAADQKRQQRLQQEAKAREERSRQEQDRYQEQNRAHTDQQRPDPIYEAAQRSRQEELQRQEAAEQLRRSAESKEIYESYQQRQEQSLSYESFGKGHVDFSGSGQHGSTEPYPNAPSSDFTRPIQSRSDQPEQPPIPSQPSPEPTPSKAAAEASQSSDSKYADVTATPKEREDLSRAEHDQQQADRIKREDEHRKYEERMEPSVPFSSPTSTNYTAAPGSEHTPLRQHHSDPASSQTTPPWTPHSVPDSYQVPESASPVSPVSSSEPPYEPQSSQTPTSRTYDERVEAGRKKQEYRDDELRVAQETHDREIKDRSSHATQQYRDRMEQSYTYESFGKGHVDFSGAGQHGGNDVPFQPFVYTASGIAPAPGSNVSTYQQKISYKPEFSPDRPTPSNQDLYQEVQSTGRITPEISRAMRMNLQSAQRDFEVSKGTPEFQAAAANYQAARDALMSVNRDLRENKIAFSREDRPPGKVSNINAAPTSRAGSGFTAYAMTPTGVQGASMEQGKATGGVTVHNPPGTAGKEVWSRSNPMCVTQAYEDSLSRNAAQAREQMKERLSTRGPSGETPKLTPAEVAAYRKALDAYEGFRRAKAGGFVQVTSDTGAATVPDLSAWAARQETYRNTVEARKARAEQASHSAPNPDTSKRPVGVPHRSNQQTTDQHGRTPTAKGDWSKPDPRTPMPKDVGGGQDQRTPMPKDVGGGQDRGTPKPKGSPDRRVPHTDPYSSDQGREESIAHSSDRRAPFGSIFSIRYNRGKYTTGEKETSSDLFNRDTKLRRDGIMRTMGSRMYGRFALYAPEAATVLARKLYVMTQASSESGSQSIRTFEQGRYYFAVGAGLAAAYMTRDVGNVNKYVQKAAKLEGKTFGHTRSLSNKEVSKKLHASINQGRTAKKEIRRMYELEASLTPEERRKLTRKIKEHHRISKETTKWSRLQTARTKEKIQKEILQELHRNSKGYGLLTERAVKSLQARRQEIHKLRREILREKAAAVRPDSRGLTGATGKAATSFDERLRALDREETQILKRIKKVPDETAVNLKHIRLKDADALRAKIIQEHNLLEKKQFSQFYGVKTSAIKANRNVLERQSEEIKHRIKSLLRKGRRSTAETIELQKLQWKLKANQKALKEHADILKLRNVRDLKVEGIDAVRKTLLKNKQNLRMGKIALINFMLKPLREGGEIGAEGLAKAITYGTNPYIHRIIRGTIRQTIRFNSFALRKVGKWTGLDKAVAPATKRVKALAEGARKIAYTPRELRKKAIKTAAKTAKQVADRMTPKLIKTGISSARAGLSKVTLRFQKSVFGRAFTSIRTTVHKIKMALHTATKFIAGLMGKALLIFGLFFLLFGLFSVIVTAISSSVPTFLIMSPDATDDKLDLSKYASVFNRKMTEFDKAIASRKQIKNYDKITETRIGPQSGNNIKEILSMMAVRMGQDLDMSLNPQVSIYISSLFDDSHIIESRESAPYSCSGCKTRLVKGKHKATCPEGCLSRHYKEEKYCPGDHVDLELIITTLVFDEIFSADSMGNADATFIEGELIGNFTITHYCLEDYPHICNDGSSSTTASGTKPKANYTIATDPTVIPTGTIVMINGKEYRAEDTGGAIKGNRIDIAVKTHSEALQLGTLQNVAVYSSVAEGDSFQNTGKWDGWTKDNIAWAKNIYGTNWSELYTGVLDYGGGIIFDIGDLETSVNDTWGTITFPSSAGPITSDFGDRYINGEYDFHKGIDIGVPTGTGVHVIADGVVTNAFYSESGGYMIIVDHGNGLVSRYLHNSENLVKAGDSVKSGDVIALSGNTGNSTGPHIHFDCALNGSYFDPMTLFDG